MKLLTKEIESKLPALYSQQDNRDPVVVVKFFDPCGSWTWYGIEYDPINRLFFGYVVGHEPELGYFSLDELASIRNRMGLGIERDLHFKACPLSKITAAVEVR